MKIVKLTKKNLTSVIKQAKHYLEKDGLVVFPSDTVYGLAANALSKTAIQKLYQFKDRPVNQSVAIAVANLILLIVIIVGLFAVNYTSGLGVLVGVIIYFPLVKFLKFVGGKKISFSLFILIGFLATFLCTIRSRLPLLLPSPCEASYYRVVVKPETAQLNKILIQEFVIPNNNVYSPPSSWTAINIGNETGYSLPEIEATIKNRGFLLKEASFQSSIPFHYYCGYTDVELNDFPLNTFYAAYYAEDLKKYPYIDTETITWRIANPWFMWFTPSRNIKFSYITPPFQMVKPLLTPLIGASLLNQWLIGIISILGTAIFTPIIKPVLIDIAQKSIKNRVGSSESQVKQTAKLIISEKGDVKEVEIKKKH